MGNLWDIPPKPAKGDPQPELVYAAVGKALSTWERVELELAVVYSAILKVPPAEACRHVDYSSQNTFVGRICVVAQAWERRAFCDQAVEGDFDALVVDLRGLVSRRNDVAHGIVVPVSIEDGPDEWALFPAMYRDKRFNQSGHPEVVGQFERP